jgi:putative membrane protein
MIMKQTLLLTTAAAAALALAACQKKEAAPEAAAPPAAAEAENSASAAATPGAPAAANAAEDAAAGPIETPAPAAAPATAAASSTAPNANGTESTEALITGVTLSNLYQVQAGKIAEAKGQSQGVKDFGTSMVANHTAMSNEMRHLFSATGTTIPTELGPRGKRMLDELNAAAPADFDKLYLTQQQTAQAAELTLVSAYAEGGESKDIKPAAARVVPKIQADLDKVNSLQAGLK